MIRPSLQVNLLLLNKLLLIEIWSSGFVTCHVIQSFLISDVCASAISNWNINIELRNFNLKKCHIPVLLSFRKVEKNNQELLNYLFLL